MRKFYHSCVGWPESDVHAEGGLIDMIDQNQAVTRRTFLKNVDRKDEAELERAFGYAPHDPTASLRMSKDWAVSYHRSKLHGKTVYYIRHSAIEYVFV
jgi:hypothetical protein